MGLRIKRTSQSGRCLLLVLAVIAGLLSACGRDRETGSSMRVQPGESIQAAIDGASEGAVIVLSEGMWNESLTISKSITLQGQGAEHTVLLGVEEGLPVVDVDHDADIEVTIEALTVSRTGERAYGEDGVRAGGSVHVALRAVAVEGNRWNGISVADAAHLSITESTITDNEGHGIWMQNAAQVHVSGTTVAANEGSGVYMADSAQAVIDGSSVARNAGAGIIAWSEASPAPQLSITGSTVEANLWTGIVLGGGVQVTLEDNKVLGNGEYGIALHERPCYDLGLVFTGVVTGKGNAVASHDEEGGNSGGAVCPEELTFLMVEEGGKLDRSD